MGAVFFSLLLACNDSLLEGKKPIKVTFNNNVTLDHQKPTNIGRPILKIAIAAMISPESTHKYYKDLLTLIGEREVIEP